MREKGCDVVAGFFHRTRTDPARGQGTRAAAGRRASTTHQPWLPDLLRGEETKSFSRTPPTLFRNCIARVFPSGQASQPPEQDGSLPLCGWSALLHTSASKPTPAKWLYNPDLSVHWGQRKCGERGGGYPKLGKIKCALKSALPKVVNVLKPYIMCLKVRTSGVSQAKEDRIHGEGLTVAGP